MGRGTAAGRWRGWADVGDRATVSSDRLDRLDVANRWFPKVRSWLALGAPLELLSPLSVVRILVLVGALTGAIGGLTGVLDPLAAAVGAGGSVLAVVLLARTPSLSERSTLVACAVATVVAASVALTVDGGVVLVAFFVVFTAITVALFGSPAAVAAVVAATVATFTIVPAVGRADHDLGVGAAVSLVAVLAVSTVWVTTRSARASSTIDADTGVPNAHGVAERIDAMLAHGDTAVATVHLDGVEEIDDALGHHAATELVRRAVEDLGQVLPQAAVIGRGTDREIVVATPVPGDEPASQRVGPVLRSIDRAIGSGRYRVGSLEVSVAPHVGYVVSTGVGADADELMRWSKLAAHGAKELGVGAREWDGASPSMTREDLQLLEALDRAIDGGELWLAYQPKMATDGAGRDVVSGVEALLRWTSPSLGFVPPDRFIPLAERTGLIHRLTAWVMCEALASQSRWREQGVELGVAVNISPLSLRTTDFSVEVTDRVLASGTRPGLLTLEVTESRAFDIPQAVERLKPLRDLGIRVSIDDFGTGYTSLSILPHLPLDEIKLDQQFVRHLDGSTANEAIVRSVSDLAQRLGLVSVAEGVEDEALARRLREYGYHLLQGYHFARPLPEADLLDFVRRPTPSPTFS